MGKLDKKRTRCDFRNDSYLSELKKPKVNEEAGFVLIRAFFPSSIFTNGNQVGVTMPVYKWQKSMPS